MSYRFEDVPHSELVKILPMRLGEPVTVMIGSDRSFDRISKTHYLLAEKRTVPCLHDECPWHDTADVRVNAYLPAQVYLQSSNVWRLAVVFLTDGMQGFRKEKREGAIWDFIRRGRFNSTPTWRLNERLKSPPPWPGFNVEPTVLRAWGMYASFKRRAVARDDQVRLYTDAEVPIPSTASAG